MRTLGVPGGARGVLFSVNGSEPPALRTIEALASPQSDAMRDRWLLGLVCCALFTEAGAVLAELRRRGLRPRSVPTGPARGAWTCAVDGATVGVVVSGRGHAAAAGAAGFWVPRSRALVLCEVLRPTAAVGGTTLALDGDTDLIAAIGAHAARGGIDIRPGRVATVAEVELGPSARQSLAAAGYSAAGPEVDAWRAAASAARVPFAACAALLDGAGADTVDLAPGLAGPPWWRPAVLMVRPEARARARRADDAVREAANAAAGASVAALLGP